MIQIVRGVNWDVLQSLAGIFCAGSKESGSRTPLEQTVYICIFEVDMRRGATQLFRLHQHEWVQSWQCCHAEAVAMPSLALWSCRGLAAQPVQAGVQQVWQIPIRLICTEACTSLLMCPSCCYRGSILEHCQHDRWSGIGQWSSPDLRWSTANSGSCCCPSLASTARRASC